LKFFEVSYPYYALIKAESVSEAKEEYIKTVSDEIVEEEFDKELDPYLALIIFSRGLSEDGKQVPALEVLEDFTSNETSTLLIDGSLL